MSKNISLTMDLLIPVIAFIDGISLGITEDPLVNRIAKGSLFLVFVYLVCSYLLKRAGKDNSFWRLTKVTMRQLLYLRLFYRFICRGKGKSLNFLRNVAIMNMKKRSCANNPSLTAPIKERWLRLIIY